MPLATGQCDHYLNLLTKTETRGAAGGVANSTSSAGYLWAAREQTSGFLRTAGDSERTSARVEWLTHYRTDVQPHMFLQDEDGVRYEIIEARRVRHDEMVIISERLEGRA